MSSPRISGQRGQLIDLDVIFYNNGDAVDPFAIRSIKIYKKSVAPHNLVETINILDPSDTDYPSPISRVSDQSDTVLPGQYVYQYQIPSDAEVPNVYFDVWEYFASNPVDTGTNDLEAYSSQLLKCCHRFWAYPEQWYCSDDLESIEFGFEPLNIKFNTPEIKPLQVGLMPLPLYDFNKSLVLPMIPYLKAYISVWTMNCEQLVEDEAMTIGLRQGSYRTNPYVVKWNMISTRFLKGTYKYRIKLVLPDGSSRVSPDFNLSVV